MNERTSAETGYSDVEHVGPHIVVAEQEWVPGPHPDPFLREEGQTAYVESYFRCVRCETERLSKRDFPDECVEPSLGQRTGNASDAPDRVPADGSEPTSEDHETGSRRERQRSPPPYR